MNYKAVLVTGGCGFIASNLLNTFVAKYPLTIFVNIDCLHYCATTNNIKVAHLPNYVFVEGDICDAELVASILEKYNIDAIFHFAAKSHVDESFVSPNLYIKNNILGTFTLLQSAVTYGKIKLFLNVSTDEVYGNNAINDNLLTEQSRLCPTNPYSASKASAEILARTYYYSFKLPVIIVRCNNVYGRHQYPEKLLPRFFMLLQDNRKCTIHGKGDMTRSFLHVDDVVSAYDIIIEKAELGQIYNIASPKDNELSILYVTKLIIKHLKNTEQYEDYITFVADRCYNDSSYVISCDKIVDLGWSPKVSFEDGLKDTLEWYKSIDLATHWKPLK